MNRIKLGISAIAMLTRIYWEEGINRKAIINCINLG